MLHQTLSKEAKRAARYFRSVQPRLLRPSKEDAKVVALTALVVGGVVVAGVGAAHAVEAPLPAVVCNSDAFQR